MDSFIQGMVRQFVATGQTDQDLALTIARALGRTSTEDHGVLSFNVHLQEGSGGRAKPNCTAVSVTSNFGVYVSALISYTSIVAVYVRRNGEREGVIYSFEDYDHSRTTITHQDWWRRDVLPPVSGYVQTGTDPERVPVDALIAGIASLLFGGSA